MYKYVYRVCNKSILPILSTYVYRDNLHTSTSMILLGIETNLNYRLHRPHDIAAQQSDIRRVYWRGHTSPMTAPNDLTARDFCHVWKYKVYTSPFSLRLSWFGRITNSDRVDAAGVDFYDERDRRLIRFRRTLYTTRTGSILCAESSLRVVGR